MRRYLIDNARKNAPHIFSEVGTVPLGCFAKNYDRSAVPALANLLKNPHKSDEEYPTFPQILFKDFDGAEDSKLFGSSVISKVSFAQ